MRITLKRKRRMVFARLEILMSDKSLQRQELYAAQLAVKTCSTQHWVCVHGRLSSTLETSAMRWIRSVLPFPCDRITFALGYIIEGHPVVNVVILERQSGKLIYISRAYYENFSRVNKVPPVNGKNHITIYKRDLTIRALRATTMMAQHLHSSL